MKRWTIKQLEERLNALQNVNTALTLERGQRQVERDEARHEVALLKREREIANSEIERLRTVIDSDHRDLGAIIDAIHVLSRPQGLPIGRAPRGLDRLQLSQMEALDMAAPSWSEGRMRRG